MNHYRESTTRLAVAATLAAWLMAAAARPAAAQMFRQDLTLHETTTGTGMMGQKGNAARDSTLYFSSRGMRHSGADGNDMILRFDQEKMVALDHRKKTYSEITFEELQRKVEQAASQMSKAANKDEMEAMRQMLGGASGEFKVTRLGPGETIAGYATVKYSMSFGPVGMELSVAPELKIPAAYYDALKLRVPPNPMFDMGKMYEEMKKIDGMTLKSVMQMKIMNMSMTTTTIVTSVDKGPIPASTFEVPAGYTAAPMKF